MPKTGRLVIGAIEKGRSLQLDDASAKFTVDGVVEKVKIKGFDNNS
jgi:hypothetical protein